MSTPLRKLISCTAQAVDHNAMVDAIRANRPTRAPGTLRRASVFGGSVIAQSSAEESGGAIEVAEVDGTPDVSPCTKLVFPNGTLTVDGEKVTYTPDALGNEETRMVIREVHGDYLTCRTLAADGTQGGADVLVAKREEMRVSNPGGSATLTGETIDANSYTLDYGAYAGDGSQRTSTGPGSVSETQKPTPRYLAYESGSGFPVEPSQVIGCVRRVNGTGVVVSSVELVWLDNTPRQWGAQ